MSLAQPGQDPGTEQTQVCTIKPKAYGRAVTGKSRLRSRNGATGKRWKHAVKALLQDQGGL